MEIKYEIHTIENSEGSGRKRVYVQLRSQPAMTTDELGNEVQEACSVTPSDLKAVMAELSVLIVRELSQGNRFYLPEIGYLSLSAARYRHHKRPTGRLRAATSFCARSTSSRKRSCYARCRGR